MNKRLKRIIAIALTISAFSTIEPTKYFNMTTTKAYASSKSSSKLSELQLNKKDDNKKEIKLYTDDDYDTKAQFKTSRKDYYTKTTLKSVNVTFDLESSNYEAKIFADNNKRSTAYDNGEEIKLDKSGVTTLYVRVYKDGKFDKNDVKSNAVNEYKIYVDRGGSSNSKKDEDRQDKIYLEDLTLNRGDDFKFSKKVTSYDINVDESDDSIRIKAEPEDEDYTVKIDGDEVTSDDKYRKDVKLSKGKNLIRVIVEDDDDNKRTYKLNINRGKKDSDKKNNNNNSESNTSTQTNNTPGNAIFPNKTDNSNSGTNETNVAPGTNTTNNSTSNKNNWIKTSTGKWRYYDENGNLLKKKWFYDNKKYWRWYYLDENGEMTIGWANDDNKWYYLNSDGSMVTGWIKPNGTWYYLNADGSMRTGWLQEGNKKYYLNGDGSMQIGTKTINGQTYNFGENGELK
ncbi:hypothetical protein UT300005_14730 [Clostridium sp. CTA-5]